MGIAAQGLRDGSYPSDPVAYLWEGFDVDGLRCERCFLMVK